MKRVSLPFRPEVVACSAGGGGVRRLHELGDAHMKTHYIQLLCVVFVIAVLAACVLAIRSGPLLAAYFIRSGQDVSVAWHASSTSRNLYAINQFSKSRGHISV